MPTYAPQQVLAAGSAPRAIAVVDLNGDGALDLAVANQTGDTVSVLLNTSAQASAAPTFATQQIFTVGTNPVSIVAVDVDGDGKPDLVVTNAGNNTLSILRNTTAPGATTPSFAAQQTFSTGSYPYSVAVADVDGDGKPDLIAANLAGGTVSVLRNTTAPGAATLSFAAQQLFLVGPESASLAVADVNGDGRPDLVLVDYSDGVASVLLNTTAAGAGTVSFADHQDFIVGSNPNSISVADINGDGMPDLVVVNQFDDSVSVLINTTPVGSTAASFADQQTFFTGLNPTSVTAADVDGDGKPDLIVTNLTDTTVSVLINTTAAGAGTPSFAAQRTFSTGLEPVFAAAADLNGDGLPDLVVANNLDDTVSVLLNTTTPVGINLDQHGITGSWLNVATGGQGLEIELYPDLGTPGQGLLFGGWFAYDVTAAGGQRWYALEGAVDNINPTAQLGIYAGYGGNFAAPPAIPATQVGTATLRFVDCTTGVLTYSFDDGRKGIIPLTRLTANISCAAAGDNGAAASDYLLSGSWFDPSAAGQGLVFDVNPAQQVFFAAWYTYAPNGQQTGGPASERWYVIQAAFAPGATSLANAPIYTDSGGVFNALPAPTPAQVGTASIAFQNCGAATLSYTFTAGANSGLSGMLNLIRTGPAPAGCSLGSP